MPEILQCHTLFRIALAEAIRTWDQTERIGDVFIASFSKSVVLDVYSEFINNFSVAMDLAKSESKRKNALSEFLQVIIHLSKIERKKKKKCQMICCVFFSRLGEADEFSRSTEFFRTHGEARATVPAVDFTTARSSAPYASGSSG